jgi:hypothetical protein
MDDEQYEKYRRELGRMKKIRWFLLEAIIDIWCGCLEGAWGGFDEKSLAKTRKRLAKTRWQFHIQRWRTREEVDLIIDRRMATISNLLGFSMGYRVLRGAGNKEQRVHLAPKPPACRWCGNSETLKPERTPPVCSSCIQRPFPASFYSDQQGN